MAFSMVCETFLFTSFNILVKRAFLFVLCCAYNSIAPCSQAIYQSYKACASTDSQLLLNNWLMIFLLSNSKKYFC